MENKEVFKIGSWSVTTHQLLAFGAGFLLAKAVQ